MTNLANKIYMYTQYTRNTVLKNK